MTAVIRGRAGAAAGRGQQPAAVRETVASRGLATTSPGLAVVDHDAAPAHVAAPQWIPDGLDIATPTAARVYDYALGGFHNFDVDRRFAEQATRIWPDFTRAAHANRAFLGRAVQQLTARGIRQFLDIGSGIPARGGVHEVVHAAAPHAKVVSVDLDPLVVAHNTHLLRDQPQVRVIHGDLRHPSAILNHPGVAELLDFAAPVAVVATAVLHFVADHDDPAGIIRQLGDATVAGSYLVLSHATTSGRDAERQEQLRQLYNRTPTPLHTRTCEQIAGLITGWELVEPGLVPATSWHPDPDEAPQPDQHAVLAAVARKPPPPDRTG